LKKIIISLIILGILISGLLILNKKEEKKEKIKIGEVTHSIFYAPLYVSDKLGYFKEEGLDIEILLTSGADKVTSAVISGDVQIGFCGSESTIYIYNQKEKDYLINIAGLTKKDGSFLISRDKNQKFNIKDLKGKHVIAGREGVLLKIRVHTF